MGFPGILDEVCTFCGISMRTMFDRIQDGEPEAIECDKNRTHVFTDKKNTKYEESHATAHAELQPGVFE